MSKVPEANVLNMVNVDDLADGSRVDDVLDLQAWRKVSQDVADGDDDSGFCASLSDLLTVGLMHGHWLLQEQVIAYDRVYT